MKRLGGDVAIEVTRELAAPLREVREKLGTMVDHLERYVATSTGPTPYPWRSLQSLRHDLAEMYLDLTQVARRVDELDQALAPGEPTAFDVSAAVDHGLRLASPYLGPGIEQLFDLGSVPPARGVAGTLALLVTQLVEVSAASARALAGSSLSVRVSFEEGVVVQVADNGAGDDRAPDLGELARSIVVPWGGTADAVSSPHGCAFEIRLVAIE
ncbi:MAG TPA: hypothetical protein VGC41_20300 [Kofleriaceae bacterium]